LVAPISGQRLVRQPDPTAEHIELGIRCVPEIGRAAQSNHARGVRLERERSFGVLGVAQLVRHKLSHLPAPDDYRTPLKMGLSYGPCTPMYDRVHCV
jgi:hypothetical protein